MGKSLEKNRTTLGYWRCTSTRSIRGGLNIQQVFSLGKDERAAEIKLIEIEYRWKRDNGQDAQGRKVWTQAGLDGVIRYLKQGEDSAPILAGRSDNANRQTA
jgi:hypothetical protein